MGKGRGSFTGTGASTLATGNYFQSRPIVSVKDYGAYGDGTTDDAAAIAAAIAAMPSDGGTVWFPSGDYVIETAIALRPGVALRGAGYLSTRITVTGAINGFIYEPGALTEGNICMSDLRIIGDGTALTLVRFTRVTNIVIERCNIRTSDIGVRLENCYHINITSCRLEDFDDYGIDMLNTDASTPTNVFTIAACDFQRNSATIDAFVRLTGTGWGSITDCTMEGGSATTNAIILNGAACVEICNNFIEFVTGAVISAVTTASLHVRIARNMFHSTVSSGTYLDFSSGSLAHVGVEVLNNRFTGLASGDTLFAPGSSTSYRFARSTVDAAPASYVSGFSGSQEVERLSQGAIIEWTADGRLVQQGTNDGAIEQWRSTDVAHGMTGIVATDVFGRAVKSSATAGGLTVTGFGESTEGLTLQGALTTATTTPSTSAVGAVRLQGYLKSGTSVTTLGANGLLVTIDNAGTTRFAFDAEGDSHQDVGTAWTNFDDFDDVALLTALSVGVSQANDPLRTSFAKYLEQHRESLERGRFVTFNENGHHFINWSRTQMLMIGAIRQLSARLDSLDVPRRARLSTAVSWAWRRARKILKGAT